LATAAFRQRRRLAQIAIAVALLTVLLSCLRPGSARADLGPKLAGAGTVASCPGTSERPFLPWADVAPYVLASGGDFEGPLSWKTSAGASIVSGNEPYKVHGAADTKSLLVPGNGWALSPSLCVGLGDPTLRLFALGGIGSTLKVQVVYRSVVGTVTQTVAVVPGIGAWSPTLPIPFVLNLTGIVSKDGLASVQFRFSAVGKAAWRIDDVYVDPWKIH
jgi:hypothetical protein